MEYGAWNENHKSMFGHYLKNSNEKKMNLSSKERLFYFILSPITLVLILFRSLYLSLAPLLYDARYFAEICVLNV